MLNCPVFKATFISRLRPAFGAAPITLFRLQGGVVGAQAGAAERDIYDMPGRSVNANSTAEMTERASLWFYTSFSMHHESQ